MLVSEEQLHDCLLNLRGRLNYETKKATRLGFSNKQDYDREKLTKEAEALEIRLNATPAIKPTYPKRVKRKKAAPPSSCGCCP